MHKITKAFVAVALASAAVLSMSTTASAAGSPEKQAGHYTLPGNSADAGYVGTIDNQFQSLNVRASGRIRLTTYSLDTTDPDGRSIDGRSEPCSQYCPLPGAPHGSIISKLGATGVWFEVGTTTHVSYAQAPPSRRTSTWPSTMVTGRATRSPTTPATSR